MDNSIDAQASHIRIRFIQNGTTILGLQIIDNGRGLTADDARRAMTFGARRDYSPEDLGHFGIGLKAASLSQATAFEIYSRQKWAPAVGRRMDRSVKENYSVGVVDPGYAAERLDNVPGVELTSGTLVEWHGLKDVIHTSDAGELAEWRNTKLRSIREHLGLTFHRYLQRGGVEIMLDTFDIERNRTLPPLNVDPIDPFKDSIRQDGYPRKFLVDLPNDATCTVETHLFPPDLVTPTFNLYGEPGESRQGIYLYRSDRLLSGGYNWAGLRSPSKEYALGRMKIDITSENEPYIALNPEKIKPVYSADFIRAISRAYSPGDTPFDLDRYFEDLRSHQKAFKKPKRHEIHLVEPAVGLNAPVLSALDGLQDFADLESIDLRFVTLPPTELFRADRINRRIDVNADLMRNIYGTGTRLSNRDGQLLKTFLYFLLEGDFKVEQRWTGMREHRHRILNHVLLVALVEDFGLDCATNPAATKEN
ncbi:ATP-binding protein [Arthrobacter koreensis]|nr:ATP-binding protein [Arthrobacter koreensis]